MYTNHLDHRQRTCFAEPEQMNGAKKRGRFCMAPGDPYITNRDTWSYLILSGNKPYPVSPNDAGSALRFYTRSTVHARNQPLLGKDLPLPLWQSACCSYNATGQDVGCFCHHILARIGDTLRYLASRGMGLGREFLVLQLLVVRPA